MPAPAVIPALIAYIKVVAVKKLVVGFWNIMAGPSCFCRSCIGNDFLLFGSWVVPLTWWAQ